MKNLRKLLSLMLVFLFALSLMPTYSANAYVGAAKIESKSQYQNEIIRVVVQLGEKTVSEGQSKTVLDSLQSKVKSEIEAKIPGISFRRDFNYLVNGFSLVTQRKNMDIIRKVPGVASVRESRRYYPAMFNAPELTQAFNFVKSNKATGEGVVVSIIDSGIDTQHPDMRLSNPDKAKIQTIKQSSETIYNSKVPYGYNFADNNDTVKDDDNKSMHGMHVAGIVAANATQERYDALKGLRGVAPEAQLLAMKVFSNQEGNNYCYDDDIVAAIEDSVAHQADIINMSLGAPMGFQDAMDPVQKAFENAREQGVLICVAAGNEQIATSMDTYRDGVINDMGMTDVEVIGHPATNDDSFAVASMDNMSVVSIKGKYIANGETKQDTYRLAFGPELPAMENLVDGKQAAPDSLDPAQVTGKYVLVERGGATFSEKALEIIRAGGKGMILYNSASGSVGSDGLVYPLVEGVPDDFSIYSIRRPVALEMVASISAGSPASFFFSEDVTFSTSQEPEKMSGFSSWGPVQNLDFKPEITAPGGNIYSTLNNGEYGLMSGTSMATPHVAGLSALLYIHAKELGLTGSDLVDFVKISLMNTSKVMMDVYESNGLPYSPRRQGAGLAQVENAMKTNVLVKYGKEGAIALRSFTGNKSVPVVLYNYSDKDYTFKTTEQKVYTTTTDANGYLFVIEAAGFTATTDMPEITVPAKGEVTVNITVNSPSTLDGFVEGNMYFYSNDPTQPDLHIPFMGFSGDYGAEDILEDAVYDNGNTFYGENKMISKLALGGDSWITLGDWNTKDDANKTASTVAFSPNGDKDFDFAAIRMVTLRNAEDIKFEVTDKNDGSETTLRVLNTMVNFRRPLLEKYIDMYRKGIDPVYIEDYNYWDGKLYNQTTGEYDLAKDGQYYIKISARVNKDSQWQSKYIPISVDTVKPAVTNPRVTENADGSFSVIFTATDKSGIAIVDDVYIDGVKSDSITNNGSEYTATFLTKPVLSGPAQINVIDNAFNKTEFVFPIIGASISINNYEAIVNGANTMVDENNALAINGVAAPEFKTVKIGKDEASAATMTMGANGTFTGTISLVPGQNKVNAYGYDATGKLIATVSFRDIFLDKEAPVITYTSPAMTNMVATSTDGMVTIAGTVSDNTEVSEITILGNPVALNADGSFSETIEVPLNRIVYVEAKDIYGNITSNEIRVNYEGTDDGVVFTNFQSYLFLNAKNKDVNGNMYTVRGYITKSDYKLYINNVEVPINPDLSFNFPVEMKEGVNYFVIKYTNNEGVKVYNEKYRVYFDTQAPTFTLDEPTIIDNKIYTNKDTINFIGKVYDNTAGYILRINGDLIRSYGNPYYEGQAINEGPFSYIASNVKNGDKMTIEVIDWNNNGLVETYTVVYDDVAPVITIQNVEEGMIYEPGVLPVIVTDEAVSSVEVNLNNKPWDGAAITEPGSYVLEVKATDLAGNVSVKTVKFTVDSKPVIEPETVTVPQGKYTDIRNLIKVTDAEDGDLTKIAEIIGADKIDYNKPGTYPVTVRVTDKAGQVVEKTINVVVSGVPVITGTADKTLPVGAKFDPMDGVKATDPEDGDITASIKVTGDVVVNTPGTYVVKYSVTDKDGNTTEITSAITIKAMTPTPGNGSKDDEVVTLIDNEVGAKVVGTTKTLNSDWKLVVKPIDKKYDGLKANAYDVYILENGVRVQPRGPVQVYIPIESDLDATKLSVFYDDTQKLNKIEHLVSSGNAVFEATHFSIYVLANGIPANGSATDTTNTSDPLPETGETSNMGLVLAGLALIGIASLTVMKKRNRRN